MKRAWQHGWTRLYPRMTQLLTTTHWLNEEKQSDQQGSFIIMEPPPAPPKSPSTLADLQRGLWNLSFSMWSQLVLAKSCADKQGHVLWYRNIKFYDTGTLRYQTQHWLTMRIIDRHDPNELANQRQIKLRIINKRLVKEGSCWAILPPSFIHAVDKVAAGVVSEVQSQTRQAICFRNS